MKGLLKGQAGFTAVEAVVGVGVAAVMVGVLGMAVPQVLRGSMATEAHLDAVHDLRISSKWLAEDIGRSSSTNLADGAAPAASAQFTWREGGSMVTCTYLRSGTLLQRQCPAGTVTVGRNISDARFARSGDLVTVDISSAPPGNPLGARSRTLTVYARGS